MTAPWLAALLATALLWLGDHANRRWYGWLPDDPPRPGRKQHARPIPLAGVLLAPAVAPWLTGADTFWFLAALAVATAFGFLDDRGKEHGRDLHWQVKGAGLWLAAGLAATGVVDPFAALGTWLGIVLFTFVLTNATNFLDNTDGVTASLAAVSLLVASGGQGWAGAAGCAALAFLPWNWPRPRLFLGDAGAYALGILSAAAIAPRLCVDARAIALCAVQLVDFVQVVIARCWLGIVPWVGDRRHLTHIVQNFGMPRWAVAPLFAALAFAVARLA